LGYFAPTSLDEALDMAAAAGVAVVAGGTDFFPALGRGVVRGDLLDLTRIAGLRGIEQTKTGWRIGAATTWRDVIAAPLPPAFDALKLAAREVGSVQIQNAGTVAGNICNASPAADGVPPLLALGASVEIASVSGVRSVPLARFITGVRRVDLAAGEIVTAVHIPRISSDAQGHFAKLGSRRYLVISIAMVAVVIRLEAGAIAEARVAVGACSPVATRLPALEAALSGATPLQLQAKGWFSAAHLEPLSPIDDVRGSGAYRMEAVAELCQRAVKAAAAKAVAHG
jgi:CO/xanthine dehydrogenase FAD-binding subunit